MPIKIPPQGFPSLTDDQVFKYFFNRRPDLLAHLINSILTLENHPRIQKLRLLSCELPREQSKDRLCFFDLHAEDEQGRAFNVEMQSYPQKSYGDRMLFYSSMLQSKQLNKGEDFQSLKEILGIHFLSNALLFPKMEKDYWDSFTPRGRKHPELQLSHKTHHFLVQLDQFYLIHFTQVTTTFEAWCYVLKYSQDITQDGYETLNPNCS